MHTPTPATSNNNGNGNGRSARTTTGTTTADAAGAGGGAVLVVGGTGFIGSAVLRELARPHHSPRNPTPLRVLSRRAPRAAGAQHVPGDLADPPTLRGACAGITTVIHAASYVGRDPRTCQAINHTGTQALLAEAERQHVTRFIYISTASVYGTGPHHGPREEQLQPAPASPASTTRLHAEQAVRAAGGTILRPHLIYGTGDHWFIPTLARILRKVPTWPQQTSPRTSAIAVHDLARIITALTHHPHPHGATYHVADPRPLPINHLLTHLRTLLHLPKTQHASPDEHRAQVKQLIPELTDHQYNLLTQDHWYDTHRIWHHTQLHPGPGFTQRFTASTPWYTQHLTHQP